jgi:chromosome segregation ATPase
MDNTPSLLIAIVAALPGLLAAVVAWRQARSAAARSDVAALVETVKSLQEENARLRACVEDLEKDYKLLRAEHLDLGRRLAETQAELQRAQAENKSLRAENGKWKARVQALETDLERLRARLEPPGAGGAE